MLTKLFMSILIRLVVLVGMHIISLLYEIGGLFRKCFPNHSKYKNILSHKNEYLGKRCFIICTGPSLTIKDLNLLKNEYTFGMNSLCMLSTEMEYRPTFYGCIDEGVYTKLRNEMEIFCKSRTKVFVSDRIASHGNLPDGWEVVPVNVAYHAYDRWFKNKFWCKFSDDCFKFAYDMFSVTHVLIQLAVYMGFSEIYLLGADCNQVRGQQVHFKDHGVVDSTIDTARARNIAGFEEVKRYADKNDIKVYNATRGGMLEVFERVDLDTLVK